MYTYENKIRVRYGETDQMGYVYHGNYALYYEETRTEMLRHIGLPYVELEDQGVIMPIRHMEIKYLKPAKYDNLITVRAIVKEMPTAKMVIDYQVFNEDGDLLNEGQTTLVFADMKTGRPCRPPQRLIDMVKPYFEKPSS
jgi:acyl-CoA thioester hydrolase